MLSFLRRDTSSASASARPQPLEGGPQRTPLLVPQLLDNAARWHATTPVVSLLSDGTTLVRNWLEVRDRAARFAAALRSPRVLGVRRGDCVATLALNSSAHLEVLFAVAGAGAIHHTLNPRLFEADIAWIAEDAGDVVVLFDSDFSELAARLRRRLPKVRHWIALTPDRDGAVPPEWLSYERLIEMAPFPSSSSPSSSSSSPWTSVPEDAPCALCYTSGTTARPKGVLFSHRSNVLHALSASHGDALDVRATSTVLMAVPIFHANGWGLAHACPMAGAALVLPGRHLAGRDLLGAARQFGVTQIAGVPTVFLDFVAAVKAEKRNTNSTSEGRNKRPLPTLVSCVVGGAACPPSLAHALRDDVGALRVDHVYGMTELSPIGTIAAPTRQTKEKLSEEEQIALGRKQGRPSLLVDVKIVSGDDKTKELPCDGKAAGELLVRGPHVIYRYANAPEPAVISSSRRRKKKNGEDGDGYEELWFATGDIATIDRFGFVSLVDRAKDVIKSGGEFISSPQLEAEAAAHPRIKQAAAIAVADLKWGERPLLVVEEVDDDEGGGSKAKLTEAEVKAFLNGKVANWWIPDRVIFAKIPLGATGKIDKKVLRARYAVDKESEARTSSSSSSSSAPLSKL